MVSISKKNLEKQKSCGCGRIQSYEDDAKKFIGLKTEGFSILHFIDMSGNGRGAKYIAKCTCGKYFEIIRDHIFSKKSCGCRQQSRPGEKNGSAKISNMEIETCKQLCECGLYKGIELSKMFGISTARVSQIKNK